MIMFLVALLLQALAFYIIPPLSLYIGNPFSMVLTILGATLIISILLGAFDRGKIKFLFPILTALIFIPSVFIFYNESAMIHTLWYLVISLIGVSLGSLANLSRSNR